MRRVRNTRLNPFWSLLLTMLVPLVGCGDDAGSDGPTTCDTHFDCGATKPYCRVTSGVGTCLAPLDECTGDDPGETDDGPAAARTLTTTAPIAAKSCTGTGLERDWYRFTLSAAGTTSVRLTWTGDDAHFGTKVYDASGNKLTAREGIGEFGSLPAGTYYVEVDPNTLLGGSEGTAAVAYEIALDVMPGN